MLKFEDPVRMQVLHPKYGKCEVRAYCAVDAKMQASALWKEADWGEMRVAVETAALRQAQREGTRNEDTE